VKKKGTSASTELCPFGAPVDRNNEINLTYSVYFGTELIEPSAIPVALETMNCHLQCFGAISL
jgi:hypothetical protein